MADKADLYELACRRFGYAADHLDWKTYRAALADEIEVDYSSEWKMRTKWEGKSDYQGVLPPPRKMKADEWVEFATISDGFDSMHHIITNLGYEIDGDNAVISAYLFARHYLENPSGRNCSDVGGEYTFHCRRTPQGWKIYKFSLTAMWIDGNPEIFAMAAERHEKLRASKSASPR
jgi:outer membrane protease